MQTTEWVRTADRRPHPPWHWLIGVDELACGRHPHYVEKRDAPPELHEMCAGCRHRWSFIVAETVEMTPLREAMKRVLIDHGRTHMGLVGGELVQKCSCGRVTPDHYEHWITWLLATVLDESPEGPAVTALRELIDPLAVRHDDPARPFVDVRLMRDALDALRSALDVSTEAARSVDPDR